MRASNGSEENPYERMVMVYRAFVSPTVAVAGLVGNLLVLLVFLTERRKTRFTVYCVALAVTDSAALLMNSLLDDFMGRGLHFLGAQSVKFDTMSPAMCKLMEYVPNVAYFGSSYLLVCFSLDRVLTIMDPVRFYSEHFLRAAALACVGTLALSLGVNLPMLVGNQLVRNSSAGLNNVKCETPGHSATAQFALYLKVVCVFALSTAAILLLNSAIVAKLTLIHRARRRLLSNPRENRMEMGRVVGHFVLSTLFFFLNLPLVVVMLLRLHGGRVGWARSRPELTDALRHLSRLFSSVKDINYAVNFFLYFAFLSTFRWRFLSLLLGPCLGRACFAKLPGHARLRDGIERYERLQEPNRKRSVIATLAHQVTHNTLGVVGQRKPAPRERSRSFEMTTEVVNSDSYNTHL